jgi:hypothetical protein
MPRFKPSTATSQSLQQVIKFATVMFLDEIKSIQPQSLYQVESIVTDPFSVDVKTPNIES